MDNQDGSRFSVSKMDLQFGMHMDTDRDLGFVEESCEGVGKEESLMRRTLADAHLDYIYTQDKPLFLIPPPPPPQKSLNKGFVEESCEGVGKEECLMRRTLVDAHLDYIYTQDKNP
ncbi:uncharacterized protein LOC112515717 [Cynara cardunculus var. scolymus]|uniref:uncharacterized protein LOC112515717 n=1 Tax=Cynara cardunculus var. scolymus TaxID=59895 RepID=UPI000D6273BC|nr:uncharacterized protein LOC112515717 [Cynara cardunculus var. scolymus]